MGKSKAVILLSGGLDSTVLYYKVRKDYETYPLVLNYGQKHELEIDKVKAIVASLECFYDLEAFRGEVEGDNMSAVHPHRNLFMLTVAAMYAKKVKAEVIFHGASRTDAINFPDCREEFFRSAERTLELSLEQPISIETPFLHFSKAEVIKKGIDLKVPFEKTLTCYRPIEKDGKVYSCGKCSTCLARLYAFKTVGSKDPALYVEKEEKNA